jgi:hypothetical protein
VVLADDFLQFVAERTAEVFVGFENGAVEVEMDHGLRTRQRVDDAGRIRRLCK